MQAGWGPGMEEPRVQAEVSARGEGPGDLEAEVSRDLRCREG